MKVLSFLLICVVLVTHTGHALALSADPPPPSFPLNPPPPPAQQPTDPVRDVTGGIRDVTGGISDVTGDVRDFENDLNSEIVKARAAALEELKFMEDARKALDDAWKEYMGFYKAQKKKLIDAFATIPFADIAIVRSILNRLIHQLDLLVVGQFMGYHAQVMAALDVGNLIPNPRLNVLSNIAGQVDGIVAQVDGYAAEAERNANYVDRELDDPAGNTINGTNRSGNNNGGSNNPGGTR